MPASNYRSAIRDRRIDLLRGLAVLAVFIDHIPGNALHFVTLETHAASDAAEVFVFLAGYSAWLAYSPALSRRRPLAGLRRILARCGRVYATQVLVVAAYALIIPMWLRFATVNPDVFGSFDGRTIAQVLTLCAQPSYVEVLPLYICLLLAFPLIWLGLHRCPRTTVVTSACLWLFVNLNPAVDLPEWFSGKGWRFNPLEWQFLFTMGAVAAATNTTWQRPLQKMPRVTALCWVFLIEMWLVMQHFSTPLLATPVAHVAESVSIIPNLLRLVSGLSVMYLVLTSAWFARLANNGRLLAVEICGKHSLAIFGLGSVLSLIGRLTFQTAGYGALMQTLVNGVGISVLIATADMLERRRHAVRVRRPFEPQTASRRPGVVASSTLLGIF